ncbi:FeoA family protein [Actinomycetota bacterium Odt1-20B]
MVLHGCAPGARVRLTHVTVPAGERLRLAELGFVRGAELRVLGRGATGGLFVGLGDARIALDTATAHDLHVSHA